ncbi:Na(+)-translocating NADH-quinone reductase subunit C [Botrimarina sp.]|uniref:Na(+)-translocating NADH-quinone reductase subunit C n=1 Tax=Botrimarina sp. TaxID=2795802 RepID=UPI0032EDFBF9
MPPRNSAAYTAIVALVLCLVCSAVVSVFAVGLQPWQAKNKELDKKKNVLRAAGKSLLVDVGVVDEDASNDAVSAAFNGLSAQRVDEIFEERFKVHLVDISEGEVVDTESESAPVDPDAYDARKAANDPELSVPVEPDALPGIATREPYAEVYEILKGGETDGYVFPIYGKGLWSTLYGFLAVEADGQTVRGITFYQHAETPGLGGEVDNYGWKALWPGKKLYEKQGEVTLSVIKGAASPDNEYAIDGLSGATITSKGVDNMIKYWLGPKAFGQFLAKQTGDGEEPVAKLPAARRLAAK